MAGDRPLVGVLALQGDVQEHLDVLGPAPKGLPYDDLPR